MDPHTCYISNSSRDLNMMANGDTISITEQAGVYIGKRLELVAHIDYYWF